MKSLIELLPTIITRQEVPCEEYKDKKVGPVLFQIHHYLTKESGNISFMVGKAPLGLITIESLIINPSLVDFPLLALETMKIMGKKFFLLEMYNITLKRFDCTRYEEACIQALGDCIKSDEKTWFYALISLLYK